MRYNKQNIWKICKKAINFIKNGDFLYDYYDSPSSLYLKEENERKGIKFIGTVAGLCCISYVLIQNILSIILLLSPLGEIYESDPTMQSVMSIFFSIFGLLLPFAVGGIFISRKTGKTDFGFNRPVSNPLMLSAVPLGFFICLAGNYITSIFVNMMDTAGVSLSAPEYNVPEDFGGRLIYTVSIAVLPALVEEFAIRGVIMQPLRRYGDKFAILASAIFFAVLHGNLIQAPFALIAGIGIGYAVCITNSVWTGVLIHFCNNLYSVAMEFMIADIQNEDILNVVYTVSTVILYALSILGSVIFIFIKNKRKVLPSFTVLSEKRKMKTFIFTIPMIIALLIMLSITKNYVALN